MSYDLKYDDVVRTLRKLASERPDFVYQPPKGECLYSHGSQPGCIVGHVVAELLPQINLSDLDNDPDQEGTGVFDAFGRNGIEASVRTLEVLSRAQARQDAGSPWKKAVEAALLLAG